MKLSMETSERFEVKMKHQSLVNYCGYQKVSLNVAIFHFSQLRENKSSFLISLWQRAFNLKYSKFEVKRNHKSKNFPPLHFRLQMLLNCSVICSHVKSRII